MVDAHGQRPGAPQQPLQAQADTAGPRLKRIVGGGSGAFESQPELQVVLQVFAHAAQVVQHGYALVAQQALRADARQLQQWR